MKIKDLLSERKMSPSKSAPLKATYMFPTMPSADPYQAYRFGMAMADHTLSHATGPSEQKAVIVAYSPQEEEIIKGAEKQTGHKGKLIADKNSRETDSTNTVSPVNNWNKK